MRYQYDLYPGWRSYMAVLCLLAEALLEGLKLPFRLAAFLLNRKAVSRNMREMLDGNR